MADVRDCIRKLTEYELLTLEEIESICTRAADLMIHEPNIKYVDSPVVVVGDLHGQFPDLLVLLQIEGPPGDASYIFLGDYVDRGENSLETILLLLAYKVMYPDQVVLLRGNHELQQINRAYGFYDECFAKYGNSEVWGIINDIFPYFSVGCVVDRRYLCIHGGVSPRVTLGKLERIDRFCKTMDDSILMDLFWSDPFYKSGASPNPRGSGFLFGEDVLKQFLMFNNLEMIIRSHQLAIEGYKWDFGGLCLTVWSAPDYMGKCSNPGAILRIEPEGNINSNSLKLYKKTRRGGQQFTKVNEFR